MCALSGISNNKIKEIIKLHQKKNRDSSGLFIAEGVKCVEELFASNIEILEIYALKEFKNINFPVIIINEDVMKKISTTDSPCEILAIAKKRVLDINDLKAKKHLILLDRITDPGNLGTIIRSASAFNSDGIILFGNCVEYYSPKVIRSSAGNFFKTPVYECKDINKLKLLLNNHKKIATFLSKDNNISISDCAKIDKYTVMFGSEADGLSEELLKICDKNIRLDMKKGVESLNLSVCASVILYELYTNKN